MCVYVEQLAPNVAAYLSPNGAGAANSKDIIYWSIE